RFADTPAPAPRMRALEVTLVNARSPAAPVQPEALAQASLDGGGAAATGQASSPLPRTVSESADEIVLAALRKRQEELEAEQLRLYTQLFSTHGAPPERKQPDLFEQSNDPGADARHQESLMLNAQISAL